VRQQQTGLFAAESRDHDAEETEELVQERQVQASLCLWWWTESRRGCTTRDPRSSRRMQKEPPVGIECGCFCRMDDHLRC
jgi:hypothetical protein